MNIGIIVQARMGSTRLPGKVLKRFYKGKTLIEIVLENLHQTGVAKVVVATSVSKNDDRLESFLLDRGELVYRGSESDVLERFIRAAEENHIDGIVRICSDNPFLDRGGISQLVEKARVCDSDYVGFRINDKPSILTHFGFWGEFVRLEALKHVAETTEVGTPAHEHVTYHVYTHPDEYKCDWIPAPDFLQGRDDIRLTIDTPEDLANAMEVYSELKERCGDFVIEDVISYLDSREDIKRSMISNMLQNKK